MTIAIYGHEHQDSWLPTLGGFFRQLSARGYTLVFEKEFFTYLNRFPDILPEGSLSASTPESHGKASLAMSIGGDGTVLRTVQWLRNSRIPVLGINTGHLGYLATCSASDAHRMVDAIADGTLVAEKRMALKIEACGMPEDTWPFALNEIAMMRGDTSAMIRSIVNIDGNFLGRFEGDGVIVATPTGSTGYNLSVGGPILQPTLDCHIISPIAPHSLTMRPVVIDGAAAIDVESSCRSGNYRVSIDGRSFLMPSGSRVTIRRADHPVTLLRYPDNTFATTLRTKLLWAGTPTQ